jgi:O-6-methylguanine DNA methyltransferase
MATAREALFAGYRACLRCHPLEAAGPGPTDAELRRAQRLRPILSAARRTRRSRSGAQAVVLRMLSTPIGPMLAGATDDGLCLLEFTDRPMLPTQLQVLARRLRRPLVAGRHRLLDRAQRQLDAYFAGDLAALDLPLVAPGSPFQQSTWAALREIAPGQTITYEELAQRAGRPGAQRAAGTANGANRLAVVIPCHRVIRKSGETGGYGGGRWRKEWLLAHERSAAAIAGRDPSEADVRAHGVVPAVDVDHLAARHRRPVAEQEAHHLADRRGIGHRPAQRRALQPAAGDLVEAGDVLAGHGADGSG